jgi:replicative DNA helicase
MSAKRGDLARGLIEVERFASPLGDLAALENVTLDDNRGGRQMTPDQLRARLIRLQNRRGLDVVAVDYAGLMAGSGRSRYEQMTDVAGSLKQIAVELGVLMIAAVQINRAAEGNKDDKPELYNLKETGAWEEHAHAVLMLHPDPAAMDNAEIMGLGPGQTIPVDWLLRKNRLGRKGVVAMRWDMATGNYAEVGR